MYAVHCDQNKPSQDCSDVIQYWIGLWLMQMQCCLHCYSVFRVIRCLQLISLAISLLLLCIYINSKSAHELWLAPRSHPANLNDLSCLILHLSVQSSPLRQIAEVLMHLGSHSSAPSQSGPNAPPQRPAAFRPHNTRPPETTRLLAARETLHTSCFCLKWTADQTTALFSSRTFFF